MTDIVPQNPVRVTREQMEKSLTATFTDALADHQITPERMAAKLDEELNATSVKVFFNSKEGTTINSEPLVDWKVRQEARRDACKLLDLTPKGQSGNYQINFFTQIVEAANPMNEPDE